MVRLRGLRTPDVCRSRLRKCRGFVGRAVISGNAKGVDTEAHQAAIEAGGGTVLVLAEGLLQHRPKRVTVDVQNEHNVLIVSQFPPQMS